METGQISRVNDYRIVWLSGIELSEKDKAAVDLSRAQERNLKSGWMTVDEIRAEQGLAALPDGKGTVVLGLEKASGQQQVPGQVQTGPGQVSGMNSQADMNLWEKFVSWLRRKKDANDKDE
jgi:hypothetical protein